MEYNHLPSPTHHLLPKHISTSCKAQSLAGHRLPVGGPLIPGLLHQEFQVLVEAPALLVCEGRPQHLLPCNNALENPQDLGNKLFAESHQGGLNERVVLLVDGLVSLQHQQSPHVQAVLEDLPGPLMLDAGELVEAKVEDVEVDGVVGQLLAGVHLHLVPDVQEWQLPLLHLHHPHPQLLDLGQHLRPQVLPDQLEVHDALGSHLEGLLLGGLG